MNAERANRQRPPLSSLAAISALVALSACNAYDRSRYDGFIDGATDTPSPDGRSDTVDVQAVADAMDGASDAPDVVLLPDVRDVADSVDGADTFVETDVVDVVIADTGPITATLSFQDGVSPTASYAGTSDTYLTQDNATTNYGGRANLFADGNSTNDRTTLIRWDVTAIPSASTIVSASISFFGIDATTSTYPIVEAIRPWREFESTWNDAAAGQPWEAAGALGASDRGTIVVGALSAVVVGATRTFDLNAAGVALVQRWVDMPPTNNGLIISTVVSADGVQFASREAVNPGERPQLTITYRTP